MRGRKLSGEVKKTSIVTFEASLLGQIHVLKKSNFQGAAIDRNTLLFNSNVEPEVLYEMATCIVLSKFRRNILMQMKKWLFALDL